MSVREYQRQMPLGGGLGTKLSARLHLDAPLLTALLLLVLGGLAVLYSAGGGDLNLVVRQSIRLGAGFLVLLVLAQRPDLAWNGCCTAVPWCCAWVRALSGWTCYPSPV